MVVNGLRCRNSLREIEALREDIFNVCELGINTDNTAIHVVEIDRYDPSSAAMITLTDRDLSGEYEGLLSELQIVMKSDEWQGHYLYHVVYPVDNHFYQIYYHNDASYTKGKWITGNVLFYHHVHDVKLHVIITKQGSTVSEARAFDEMEMEFFHRHATKILNHVTTTLENSKKGSTPSTTLSTSPFSPSVSSSASPAASPAHSPIGRTGSGSISGASGGFGRTVSSSTILSSSNTVKSSPTGASVTSSRYFSPVSPSTAPSQILSNDPSTFTGTNGSTITIDPNLPTPSYRNSPNTSTGYIFPTSPVRLNPKTNMLYTVDVSSIRK